MVEGHRIETMASNLFYAQTPGFKSAGVVREGAYAPRRLGVPTDVQTAMFSEYFDPSPGPMRSTNKPLDFALEGGGVFVVQPKSGVAYSRDQRVMQAVDEATGEAVRRNGRLA